ncbi:MAG: hypothetical protein E4H14_02015 [Candidatus Thorarchaeota archaeon]|nr:MAG: hypothetical protein E4H14_02015 [Candidatus Thorarchaeota archaeon]
MTFEDDETREESTETQEYDWRNYGDHDQSTSQNLDAKDVLALTIAALQTIFLPLVILGVFMLIIGIAIGLLFS